MLRSTIATPLVAALFFFGLLATVQAQDAPYDKFPEAKPPYFRVQYEPSEEEGKLEFGVNYTVWIPADVETLRGVIVHQHGCGVGSCKSGLTGAFDLHWQALAAKHDCALLAPSYAQPDKSNCQLWCDPRNGSSDSFLQCLADLGDKSGHPELKTVPWALWGHSGGGHWAGGMTIMHPERVAAAWLRSGVPLVEPNPDRPTIKPHELNDAILTVPIICNLGTKEGVTVTEGRFSKVWPANQVFFDALRSQGGLIGIAIDPLTAHECGNQRYMAIRWLDACLTARLPKKAGEKMQAMATDGAWLATVPGEKAVPQAKFAGDPLKAAWLPNEAIAKLWMQYVTDTAIADTTPPPAPFDLKIADKELSWQADADLESGIASFIIERDGEVIGRVPEKGKNSFGRPIFQGLQYSDTPAQPLVPMRYVDQTTVAGKKHSYRVIAENTTGLKSKPSAAISTKAE